MFNSKHVYLALAVALAPAATAQAPSAKLPLAICVGAYALCASSGAELTTETIVVNGKSFRKGHAICPVLIGPAIANMSLMNNSCASPDGTLKTVWSLFGNLQGRPYPQAPSWASAAPVYRQFTTAAGPGLGMSNMWSFPCVVRPKKTNGAILADCFGPLNESPFTSDHVLPGTEVTTGAPLGAPNPVGGNF